MAAGLTVPQLSPSLNSSPDDDWLTPRQGVVTLFGYGIVVRVERGHLVLADGIGAPRRRARFARVGRGLRRLVVIGSDGMVSLAALRWLADQKASFLMLDRDGSVLVATGPVGPSDARLRRAQGLAHHTGLAVAISRGLIDRKLAGQERVVRDVLHDAASADAIVAAQQALMSADALAAIRQIEAQAALTYWSAWRSVPIQFPHADFPRVPNHWRAFGARQSALSGSPRVAANPPNAILNYLFALLEAETRVALVAVGLDPGLGVLHVDTNARDSLALDLMEVVRPDVEAYVLRWLLGEPLHRGWFLEMRNGQCRLMADLAARLSETSSMWRRAIAPVAEWVAATLWSTVQKSAGSHRLPTRLTQQHRREAKGNPTPNVSTSPKPPRVCRGCGAPLRRRRQTYCVRCGSVVGTKALVEGAVQGRKAAQSQVAQERRSATQLRNRAAERAWNPNDQPAWLTEAAYVTHIQPALASIKVTTLMTALGVSAPYAINVRAGRRRPHPRHWLVLAQLARVRQDTL